MPISRQPWNIYSTALPCSTRIEKVETSPIIGDRLSIRISVLACHSYKEIQQLICPIVLLKEKIEECVCEDRSGLRQDLEGLKGCLKEAS